MGRKTWYDTKAGYKAASRFEAEVMDWLTDNDVNFEYEAEQLKYSTPIRGGRCASCGSREVRQERSYTPDIRLSNGTFIEIKGKFTPKKRNLMRYVIKDNPERTIRFIFYNNPYLTKRKANMLSDWARQQGVDYHIWNPPGGKKNQQHWVPEEWL